MTKTPNLNVELMDMAAVEPLALLIAEQTDKMVISKFLITD